MKRSCRNVIGIVPVKLSERLPGKHLLKIGGTTVLESIIGRIGAVMEVVVYSKISVPVPYLQDSSSNIMELVSDLSEKYGAFMLVGGDMPFFTVSDVKKMLDNFHGRAVVPRHHDGRIEPLFAIYNILSKKAPTFREEMNCDRRVNKVQRNIDSVPMGSGELTPDKPPKKDGGRWSKTFGIHEEGTVGEAGTSDALAWRGCQSGKLKPEDSLTGMIARMNPVYIDASEFSQYAFFNINTEADYREALEILKDMDETGEMK